MPLGLDLRGGLYLLYQVDVNGAVAQAAATATTRISGARCAPKTSRSPTSTRSRSIRTSRTACACCCRPTRISARCAPRSRRRSRISPAATPSSRRARAVDCVHDPAAGARAARLRHHLQHHHAAQPREHARRFRAHRAAPGPRSHRGAAARRAELGRGQGHARQGGDAGVPPGRSAPDSAAAAARRSAPRSTTTTKAASARQDHAQARHHRHRRPADQRHRRAPARTGPQVQVTLDSAGGEEMLRTTRANVGKRMGVVFIEQRSETVAACDGKPVTRIIKDEKVINAATIQGVFGNRFHDHRPHDERGARPVAAAARRRADGADLHRQREDRHRARSARKTSTRA